MMKNLPYTRSVLFALLLLSISANAQWVNLPDTNFGTWLSTTHFSGCVQGNNSTGWQLDTTCPAVVNAATVSCYGHGIRNLWGIQFFDRLQTLVCRDNLLTSLPPLPDSLTDLTCSYNNFSSVPVIPAGIRILNFNNNRLTSLPPLPAGLRSLHCRGNQLTSLPALPDTLTYLQCDGNFLTSLPALPSGLIYISCTDNFLTSLPPLPASLNSLYCYRNNLTSLPALPAHLNYLCCYSNQLTSLPTLPDNLTNLFCGNNLLTSLPALPPKLATLGCVSNQLTTLPTLPDKLIQLYCDSNQITSLPEFPDSMMQCYISNNPLTCFPRMRYMRDLRFYNTPVTCVPNYGTVDFSLPQLNTLPLCDLFNPNGCTAMWNLSGNTYYDKNRNCLKGLTDNDIGNARIQLRSGGSLVQETFTGGRGFYSFDVDNFTDYTISVDTSTIPFNVSCPASGIDSASVSASDSMHYAMNFAFECKDGFDLEARSVHGWSFRPGTESILYINAGDLARFYGLRCVTGLSGTVKLVIQGSARFIAPVQGALMPSSFSGDTVIWNIADFGTLNFWRALNCIVATDSSEVIGACVCLQLIVDPITGDNNPANNVLIQNFIVVGSWDPNNKQVSPPAEVDINGDRWLTYVVNFQNTGTDVAHHIYIDDTLDTHLDVSTFQLTDYSHEPLLQMKGNVLRFNFPNINLPDSNVNEPGSHGFVMYRIKLKDNLPLGTEIRNTAYIYFDFNEPVVTNTTLNTLAAKVTSVINRPRAAPVVRIFPNPAKDRVTISVDESLTGCIVTLSDITGRTLLTSNIENRLLNIETGGFSRGVYFVAVRSAKGIKAVKKLLIE